MKEKKSQIDFPSNEVRRQQWLHEFEVFESDFCDQSFFSDEDFISFLPFVLFRTMKFFPLPIFHFTGVHDGREIFLCRFFLDIVIE